MTLVSFLPFSSIFLCSSHTPVCTHCQLNKHDLLTDRRTVAFSSLWEGLGKCQRGDGWHISFCSEQGERLLCVPRQPGIFWWSAGRLCEALWLPTQIQGAEGGAGTMGFYLAEIRLPEACTDQGWVGKDLSICSISGQKWGSWEPLKTGRHSWGLQGTRCSNKMWWWPQVS